MGAAGCGPDFRAWGYDRPIGQPVEGFALACSATNKTGERSLSPYRSFLNFLADDAHIGGLGPLLPFGHLKGNLLAFFKGPESLTNDGGIMDKTSPSPPSR